MLPVQPFMTTPSARVDAQPDVLSIEQSLRAAVPEAVFAAASTVRRIVRADLDVPLLRPRIPHRDCLILPPARLFELADDVWALPPYLPDTIILLARPEPGDFAGRGNQPLLREYWRRLFHGCVDVAARRLELGAQSLGRFPMVGCQVPSAWECLLPAWSFLWGMQVWEHYFFGGDKRLLRRLWPAVWRNLEGARRQTDRHGLFSGPFWNLLELAPIDHDHQTVLHNSMLLVGALRAGEKCATVLGETAAAAELGRRRAKLTKALNRLWNPRSGSYPDALLDRTGAPSRKTCQHTSMLAIMCGVATPEIARQALRNLRQPPRGMTRVASPFAMQFFYEALEEAG